MIQPGEFEKKLQKLLQQLPPTTDEAFSVLMNSMLKGLASIVSFEAGEHIKNHQGFDCAERLIASVGPMLEIVIREYLNKYLVLNGLEPIPTSDVNTKTRDAILQQIQREGG